MEEKLRLLNPYQGKEVDIVITCTREVKFSLLKPIPGKGSLPL